jgi:hypothetical protein
MTTSHSPKRGRPLGSRKPDRRLRRDYRFHPQILAQIEQGRKLVGSPHETEFVEQAIRHYVAWLAGQFQADLSEFHQSSAALPPTLDEIATTKKTAQPSQEPTIRIDPLKPDGLMRSFQIHYKQHGLEAIAGLYPIDEHCAALGYRFECHCESTACPAPPWGVRQKEHSLALQKLASVLILEALEQEGWQPEDAAHPQAPETIWRYLEAAPPAPGENESSWEEES